jgi:hypothetical protein
VRSAGSRDPSGVADGTSEGLADGNGVGVGGGVGVGEATATADGGAVFVEVPQATPVQAIAAASATTDRRPGERRWAGRGIVVMLLRGLRDRGRRGGVGGDHRSP